MNWVKFEGLSYDVPLGFYEEEGIIGNRIVVDIWLSEHKGVVYRFETILALVNKQIRQRAMLIEKVAADILQAIHRHYGVEFEASKVILRKLHPPIIGRISASMVTISSKFDKKDEVNKIEGNGIIGLENMRFDTRWGDDEMERAVGYPVDITLYAEVPILKAAASDKLEKTLNYATMHDVCRFVCDDVHSGPEAAIKHLEQRIKKLANNIASLDITITRTGAFAEHGSATYTLKRRTSFEKICPRCGKSNVCYASEGCWCMSETLFSRTRELLTKTYGEDCLCEKCLREFTK